MSEVPLEYKMLSKKFSKSIQKSLGDDLVSLLVYGGSASERVYAGVSDIDFFIILKSIEEISKPLSELYQIIGTEINSYMENPLFSTLLDHDIYTVDQLPDGKSLNGFSSIRAISLKTGTLLLGKNPFEDIDVSKDQLREGARRMIQEYLEKLTSFIFMAVETPEDEETLDNEKEFLAVDAVLSTAQAYRILEKHAYVSMPDVVFLAETEPVEGLDSQLVMNAGFLKQGIDTEIDNFYYRAIDFCGSVISLLDRI